jgi:protein-S-isoprenylcysteine O-methyltransferase Ste14
MAIISCPECNKQISSSAINCPHCAYPIRKTKPTIIEQTAKKWKGAQLVGVLLLLLGFMQSIVLMDPSRPSQTGPLLILIGLTLYLAAKAGAWWHHR